MDAIRKKLRSLVTGQDGATAIEYGLIVGLIAIALIISLESLGGGSNGMWTDISSEVVAATG